MAMGLSSSGGCYLYRGGTEAPARLGECLVNDAMPDRTVLGCNAIRIPSADAGIVPGRDGEAMTGIGQVGSARPPRIPVECGDLPFVIKRDGTWVYRGSPIGRKELVCLFSSVLKREADGSYWLEKPAERGRIEVEETPW